MAIAPWQAPEGSTVLTPAPQELDHACSVLESAEREKLRAALAQARQNRFQAAKLLGVSRSTLYEKLKRYHLSDKRSA